MGLRFYWTLFSALLIGTVFLQLPDTTTGASNRVGAMFFGLMCTMVR